MTSIRYSLALLGCCLLFLLADCGSIGTASIIGSKTSSSSAILAPGTTPRVTTVQMPSVQTSCPPAGTARAAVMAPLALGPDQNIVYLVTEFHGNTPTSTLKRYDLTTGGKTEIVKLAGVSIPEAQVSADGQWLLFVNAVNQQYKLQLVRMDGQGLQTLYCVSNGSLQNVLWSTNEKLALFSASASPQGFTGLYVLNVQSGKVQLELQPMQGNLGSDPVIPLTWLDNTRAYVSFAAFPIAPIDQLGLLDTSRGPNQQMSDLTSVYQDKTGGMFNYPCWDADSSYDASTLFVAKCSGISAPNCSGSCLLGTREGPSSIYTEPGKGGSLHTLLTTQTLGIAAVRSISSSTLLLQIENFSRNLSVDTSQNGLWKVKTNGTGLTRLTTEAKGVTTSLCPFSQNPWSNVSRNGKLYAFETTTTGPFSNTSSMSFAPLSGGIPYTFASISDGTQLSPVGWTTM